MLLTLELATIGFVSFFEEEEHDRSVAMSQINKDEEEIADDLQDDIDDEEDEEDEKTSHEDIFTNDDDTSAYCSEYF
jgi:hypothetical protein